MTGLDTTADNDWLAATARGEPPTPHAATGPVDADLERGAMVARYIVLARLGAGGMGVVYAAYDPELDRKVALKLLHPDLEADPLATGEARSRLVREAQALARINHPHIVAIHDVGEHQRSVWLAMEYVDGETLAAWLAQRRRTWREVLEVLTPAAHGLAAAHAAGLVHRDVKPDNLMLGRDGRVRVMDLGLSRVQDGDAARVAVEVPIHAPHRSALADSVTRVGSILGTPAYMSPEQFRGATTDARTDVFSFCVTLWEALMGERPFAGKTVYELEDNVLAGKVRLTPRDAVARRVPAWLRRVCLQGLAVRPEQRFASMTDLLAALARGQGRARTRGWLAAVGVAGAVAAAVVGAQRYDRASRIAACEAAGASIAEVWNDEARARVREGLVATGLDYALVTADKIMPFLDGQAAAWREQRTRACEMADLEGTLDAELRDRAEWCLDERRMELAALVTVLARADASVAQKAMTAAAGLTPVSTCTDSRVLAALPSPPVGERRAEVDAVRATLSRLRARVWTGKSAEDLADVGEAIAAADALGWSPLSASARQLAGSLHVDSGTYAEGEAASLAAFTAAAKVQAWGVAADAAIDLVANVGLRQARHAEGKTWAEVAEVAIFLAGDPLGLREATRLFALVPVLAEAGELPAARTAAERALAIQEAALGPDHPHVASSINQLAICHNVLGEVAEAKAGFERARVLAEAALGPDHPRVAAILMGQAQLLDKAGAFAEARVMHERIVAIRTRALGAEHPLTAQAIVNLAESHRAQGAPGEARALLEGAIASMTKTLGPDHRDVGIAFYNLANILQATGAHAEAVASYRRALVIAEKTLGRENPSLSGLLRALAVALTSTSAYAEARALHERALAIDEKALGSDNPTVGDGLYVLASLLHTTGALAEAKVHLERALAIFERSLGPDHPRVALVLTALAELGSPREHRTSLERAIAIYDAHEGAQTGEALAHFNLARALLAADRDRALAEARRAADEFRREGDAGELARVEAFLAEHGRARPPARSAAGARAPGR